MDGSFVPPITFGSQMVEQIRPHTTLPLDCHLMVNHPKTQLEAFAHAGASIISVHVEACKKQTVQTLKRIKRLGIKACAVCNPETPAEALFECVAEADMLLVMSVHPGWGGQKFIPESLKKIEALRACAQDGGVTPENVKEVISAGANVIVAGSAVFRAPDMRAAIAKLRGE